jgi:hypothetical protein
VFSLSGVDFRLPLLVPPPPPPPFFTHTPYTSRLIYNDGVPMHAVRRRVVNDDLRIIML